MQHIYLPAAAKQRTRIALLQALLPIHLIVTVLSLFHALTHLPSPSQPIPSHIQTFNSNIGFFYLFATYFTSLSIQFFFAKEFAKSPLLAEPQDIRKRESRISKYIPIVTRVMTVAGTFSFTVRKIAISDVESKVLESEWMRRSVFLVLLVGMVFVECVHLVKWGLNLLGDRKGGWRVRGRYGSYSPPITSVVEDPYQGFVQEKVYGKTVTFWTGNQGIGN